jgi:SanA protein
MTSGLAKQLHADPALCYVFAMRPLLPNRKIRVALLLCIMAVPATILLADRWIQADANSRLYHNIEELPKRKVGLVLGCAPNIYFHYRVDAAVALYNADKIEFILVSGDNHIATYDEASAMKDALISKGIPPHHIYCDYAGFSTIDSLVRARKVFGQKEVTVISQPFHVRRALFIAKRRNLDAVGYCAKDVEISIAARTQLREAFARVKTILDLYLLNRQPRFLGDPVEIP